MLATPTFEIEQNEAPARMSLPLDASSQNRTALADRPRRVKRRNRKVAAGGVCLVVSADGLKRMMFGRSAERCGWQQVVCEDVASALEHLESGNVGMVLVDTSVASEESLATGRWLVERLAGNKQVLTVVCGRTGDAGEEIWAREQGVWMYLPGVAPESDLDPLMLAGREVSVRMQRSCAFAA